MKKIIRPTIDCNNCNQDGVDENGSFYCKWEPKGGVKVVEDNRCWHVLFINEFYNKAVAQGRINESVARIEELKKLNVNYVEEDLNEDNFRSA